MPSSTTRVTLRSCNITSFGFEFTLGLNNLTQLDLSSNNLVAAYAGTGNQLLADRCSLTFCELEEYNLSYNKLTEFPTTPLNVKSLQKFYIQGNDISNFTVNSTTFKLIKRLADFNADSPDNSAVCNAGQWKLAHGTNFCVTDSGSPSTSDNSFSRTNPIMFVLIAGVVVVILLMYVLAWQWITYRKDRPSETLSRASSHDFYSIFNRDFEDHETMRVRLAADPIIVTNRLAYDEADVFSFGVVLSELDTNDYPYWNATNPPGGKLQEGEILLLVAAGQMRPSFSTECPAPILGVASHCLQVRPEDRPSAAELLQVFQELLLVQSMSSNTRVSSLSMDRIGNGKE
ncbi:uncharacterized protein KRP23_8513 [Phytophthora ramorum]|uniref:uncharacterized protein n=1 Tax=Phytophthora ramorum TaxID=164328 RepID=UPI0030A75B09|nr:hypothetical protein KRP23_8513 [Phytophthora ramorum]